jgi:SAM-dependent methyltransferase
MDESWKVNVAAHVAYYTTSVEGHSESHKAVGWGSRESQEIRFGVLTEVGLSPGASVIDVGCGLGDLYGYLKRVFKVPPKYQGIDITQGMVERARARYPAARFEVADILDPRSDLTQADFVLASGIFALLNLDLNPYIVLESLLAAMFQRCRVGLAFNSLSAWSPRPEPGKFFVDPVRAVGIAKSITPWVIMRHDYLPHDFTIFMYRYQQRRHP